MESDREAFESEELMKAVDQFDWIDAESSEWGITPANAFYQFQPPMQYARYYLLLRVMLDSEQKSPRSLALTSLMLKIKPNNYYALMLRKDCLTQSHLNKGLMLGEICFINHLLEMNSKQYQLWTYKKLLFDKFKPEEADLQLFYSLQTAFLDSLLEIDSKNYHVWDYKLWLTIYFAQENEQLQWSQYHIFNDAKIDKKTQEQLKDIGFTVTSIDWSKCYSLWSFRYNLAQLYYSKAAPSKRSEFQMLQARRVKDWLKKETNLSNECGWTYITGLAANAQNLDKDLQFQIYQLAKQIYASNAGNRFAGNACLQMLQLLKEKYNFQCEQEMKHLLASLAINDPVREKYYNYLIAH